MGGSVVGSGWVGGRGGGRDSVEKRASSEPQRDESRCSGIRLVLRGGRYGLSGAAFVRRQRAHTRTHTRRVMGGARQGARKAKELMAFSGISEMKKRSGSVKGGRSPALCSPCST